MIQVSDILALGFKRVISIIYRNAFKKDKYTLYLIDGLVVIVENHQIIFLTEYLEKLHKWWLWNKKK